MDNEKLDRYLRTIGKRTLVNCFYLFRDNYMRMNSEELGRHIPEFDYMDADNSETSLTWKASAAIGIFNNGREYDAVKLCLASSRLDDEIIQKARKILEEQNESSSDDYQLKIEKAIRYEGITYKKKAGQKKKTKVLSEHYMRDPQAAAYAKQQAGYKCEFNPEHKTFTSGISNLQYVEAHHLIPMRYQNQFEQSLDIPENIVALCPNCHRAIHHGSENCKKEILEKLLQDRKDSLKENGIDIQVNDLTIMYRF